MSPIHSPTFALPRSFGSLTRVRKKSRGSKTSLPTYRVSTRSTCRSSGRRKLSDSPIGSEWETSITQTTLQSSIEKSFLAPSLSYACYSCCQSLVSCPVLCRSVEVGSPCQITAAGRHLAVAFGPFHDTFLSRLIHRREKGEVVCD